MTEIYKYDGMKMAAVASFPESAWKTYGEDDSEVAQLAKRVSWLYGVHHKRAGATAGLPIELQRNGEMVEKADWPVTMDMPDLLYRYSLATDLYAENYMFQVKSGAVVESVRWLDPTTITIKQNNKMGLVGFTRTLGAKEKLYPVKNGKSDVMWTWLPGLIEVGPGDPPANVVEDAANVLRYMTRTSKGFFEKGAVDNWVLFGPQSAIPEPARKRFLAWWRRTMMGGQEKGGNMEVLHPDSRIERINSPVADWTLPDLNELQAEAICIAHQTPLMLMRPEQGSDKAMMERVTKEWVNTTIIPHAQRMIDTLNEQLFDDLGYEWVINAEAMNVNMQEEVEKAQAFSTYVASGVPAETAAAMLGLDVPEGMLLVEDEPEPEPEPQLIPPQLVVEPEPAKSYMWHDEVGQLRRYLRNDSSRRLEDFKANHLTEHDKKAIAYEVANGQDAPFPDDSTDNPGDGRKGGNTQKQSETPYP